LNAPNVSCSDRLKSLLAFDYTNGAELITRYCNNLPYPHIVIDGFFADAVASKLAQAVIQLRDDAYKVSFRSLAQKKLQLGRVSSTGPSIYPIFDALMGLPFTSFIQTLCKMPGLDADRQFAGAGLQRYHRHGFSEVHLDANRHPYDLDRFHRVNLIVFLNPKWRQDWGGELVLWSRSATNRPSEGAVQIQPAFNRAVIFSASDSSWHSVNRVTCPMGWSRNSMVIYFYDRRPVADDGQCRSVIWHSTRSKARQAAFEISNRLITLAKPYAPYLRWLRPTKFDGI
jgi:Rps23 Pro-64 3,4-dihydroxylase Tpa1-like proline 4-hydroxylase